MGDEDTTEEPTEKVDLNEFQDGPVVLGVISPGEVATGFWESTLTTIWRDKGHFIKGDKVLPLIAGHISIQTGPRIVPARNSVVSQFLFGEAWQDARWLMLIDADMTWGSEAIFNLHAIASSTLTDEYPKVIVGGLCFAGSRSLKSMYPTIFKASQSEEEEHPKYEVVENYHRDALLKVDATGAAFLLIHRNVLIHMGANYPYGFGTNTEGVENPHPWFAEGMALGGTTAAEYGEDIVFCQRAAALGYGIWVHSGTRIGHVKPQILDEAEWDSMRRDKSVVVDAASRFLDGVDMQIDVAQADQVDDS